MKKDTMKKTIVKKPTTEKLPRRSLDVTEAAFTAMNRIAEFNPDKSRKELVSEIILEAAKAYKGRSLPKKVKKSVGLKK